MTEQQKYTDYTDYTDYYKSANLEEEKLEEIKNLESKLGDKFILIAYEKTE